MTHPVVRAALAGASILAIAACNDAGSLTPEANAAAAVRQDESTPEAAPAADPAASEAFASLVEDYEAFQRENSLSRRARDGDLDAMSQWPDVSAEHQAEETAQEAAFLERLETIDRDGLDRNDRVSYDVLDYSLRFSVELAPFDTARTPFLNDSGFFTAPTYAAASTRPRNAEQGEVGEAHQAAAMNDAHAVQLLLLHPEGTDRLAVDMAIEKGTGGLFERIGRPVVPAGEFAAFKGVRIHEWVFSLRGGRSAQAWPEIMDRCSGVTPIRSRAASHLPASSVSKISPSSGSVTSQALAASSFSSWPAPQPA